MTFSNSSPNIRWILISSVGYLIFRTCKWLLSLMRLPPGPTGLPWIGYTPCIGDGAFDELQRLHARYGPILSFRICGQLIVVFSGIEGIKAASLEHRSWIGRHTMLTNHLLAGSFGISNYDGEKARDLRRCLVRNLHLVLPSLDFQSTYNEKNNVIGQAGKKLELPANSSATRAQADEKIDYECEKLIHALKEMSGCPVNVNRMIRRLVWMVVWRAFFGSECSLKEQEISELMTNIATNNAHNGPFQYKQMLPLYISSIVSRSETLRKLLGLEQIWLRYQKVLSVLRSEVNKAIDRNQLPENCILSKLIGEHISMDDLYRLCFEMMAAGVDTTTLTIVWACNCWANGTLHLKPNAGFTQADLNTVHRMASVVPLALPHVARHDNTVNGYFVPRGAIVIFNLWAVHQSQLETLDVPNKCPVLRKSGSKPATEAEVQLPIPFSLGSRACPGFQFATRLIRRVMTKLVDNFRIEFDETEVAKVEKHAGLTRLPLHERYKFISV